MGFVRILYFCVLSAIVTLAAITNYKTRDSSVPKCSTRA